MPHPGSPSVTLRDSDEHLSYHTTHGDIGSMQDLKLILNGADPEGAARDLTAALADADVTLSPRPLDAQTAAQHKSLDPMSVAALLVAIPGAVLAAMDIADRLAKRHRAQALIDTARRIRTERGVEVLALTATGNRLLADLDPDSLLALASTEE